MHKKGQIEMIGLVIVVILLAIGLLLYFKFGILRADNGSGEDPTMEIAYVNNLMGAVLNIEICENERGVSNIEGAVISCFDGQAYGESGELCNGLGACDYSKAEIRSIIGELELKKIRKFSVSVEKSNSVVDIIKDCETGIVGRTRVITPEREAYTVKFTVC